MARVAIIFLKQGFYILYMLQASIEHAANIELIIVFIVFHYAYMAENTENK